MTCPYTKEQVAAMRVDYANLVSGKTARVIVDQNGERVEFTAGNAAALAALIQNADLCLGTGRRNANGPLRFFF